MPAVTRPGTLAHVTLLTGDVRISPREEVSREAIEALRPLLGCGGGPVPALEGYAFAAIVRPDVLSFTVARDAPDGSADVLVSCLACREEEASEAAWGVIVDRAAATLAVAPGLTLPPLPWLAVAIQPALVVDMTASLEGLGDFARCLAWAWLEEEPA